MWRRPPAPMFIGGAEISQRLLAREIAQKGHRVTYIGGHEHSRTGESERDRLIARLEQLGLALRDDGNDGLRYEWEQVSCGAVPQRRIATTLNNVIDTDPPDVVISSQEGSGDLLSLVPGHITTVGWLHSISDVGLDVLKAAPNVALATSRFVAMRCRPPAGTRVVIFYPPFAPPVTPDHVGNARHALLMVNPVPDKGVGLVHQLASAMPERPFTLVEGWWPPDRPPSLPNVSYVPSQWSMAHLYRDARLLLVPSMVEEAFGRVAIEAGLHGVPAIASHLGGLPEAVGAGGLTLDPADMDAWRAAVTDLDDPDTHTRFAHAASDNAQKYLRPVVSELTDAGVLR
ncbi:MAG: glycosyltransferase [Haloechinothrix sp.]